MSSFSRGLKLSMSVGSSNTAAWPWLGRVKDFLLNVASTNSGFIPAFRHLKNKILDVNRTLSYDVDMMLTLI